MKFNLRLATLFCLVTGLAQAPMPGAVNAQSYNWTGFYAGVNAGFNTAKDEVEAKSNYNQDTLGGSSEKITHQELGFAGGVQAGYNYQLGRFVPGVELDLGYLRFNGEKVSAARFNP